MQLSQLRKVDRHKTFIKTIKAFLVSNQLSLNLVTSTYEQSKIL